MKKLIITLAAYHMHEYWAEKPRRGKQSDESARLLARSLWHVARPRRLELREASPSPVPERAQDDETMRMDMLGIPAKLKLTSRHGVEAERMKM